jgi:ABC-type uncharacterized transport system ATPase subunit
VVILDLFGLEPTEYYLLVDKYAKTIKEAGKTIIYHSHSQQQEVSNLLAIIEARGNIC